MFCESFQKFEEVINKFTDLIRSVYKGWRFAQESI